MMRRLIALAAAGLLLFAPYATAQDISVPAAPSGGGANVNLSNAYDSLGFSAVGAKTTVTASASANTKGTIVSIGTTAHEWAQFFLLLGPSSTSTVKFIVDICTDNACASVLVPNLYVEPTSGVGAAVYQLPLDVANGTTLYARVQASTGGSTLQVAMMGEVKNASSPPNFTTMTALSSPDLANTRVSGTGIATQGTGSTTFDTIVASTAATYGAFLVIPGNGSSNPTHAQETLFTLATGAALSEVGFGYGSWWTTANSLPFVRDQPFLVFKSVASGTRLSGQFLVNTTGDTVRAGVYAFN